VCQVRNTFLRTMTLSQKQRKFTKLIAQLILWAYDNGYEITFGEAYRTLEQAKRNAILGIGSVNSLHTQRLAVDLNLFKDGKWLTATADHKPLGEQWEAMGGTWGGRFNDGNHYSLEHNGYK
jgi:hypothetical protein